MRLRADISFTFIYLNVQGFLKALFKGSFRNKNWSLSFGGVKRRCFLLCVFLWAKSPLIISVTKQGFARLRHPCNVATGLGNYKKAPSTFPNHKNILISMWSSRKPLAESLHERWTFKFILLLLWKHGIIRYRLHISHNLPEYSALEGAYLGARNCGHL